MATTVHILTSWPSGAEKTEWRYGHKSLLIFQFMNVKRQAHWNDDIKSKCDIIIDRTKTQEMYLFLTDTDRVVYFLVPLEKHLERFYFNELDASLKKHWGDRIKMIKML
jgi:hypothetical protein